MRTRQWGEEAKPRMILLIPVMPFLCYTVVKEAEERMLAQEATMLEKATYRVRQCPCVGAAAEEIVQVVNREQSD